MISDMLRVEISPKKKLDLGTSKNISTLQNQDKQMICMENVEPSENQTKALLSIQHWGRKIATDVTLSIC